MQQTKDNERVRGNRARYVLLINFKLAFTCLGEKWQYIEYDTFSFYILNGRLANNMLSISLQLQGVWKNVGANTSTEHSAPPLGHSPKHIYKEGLEENFSLIKEK